MASSSSEKVITLKSSDGQTFNVEANMVGSQSLMIKNLIESHVDANGVIPLDVHADILPHILNYCKIRAKQDPPINDEELKKWDEEFIKCNQGILFDLIMAAYYLRMGSLLDLICRTLADMIKDMSAEEMREIFRFMDDYTPEELEHARNENSWVFERYRS
ncbi:unnamed protein product [Amaranthus hypochondriacus]